MGEPPRSEWLNLGITMVKSSSSGLPGMPLSTDVVLSKAGRADMRSDILLSFPGGTEGNTIVRSSSLEAEKSFAAGALLLLLLGRDSVRCRDDAGSGLRLGMLGLASRLGGAAVFARFLLALVVGAGPLE